MRENIAVALSGGIDSLAAAYLLKEQNNKIFGIHFLTGYEKTYQKAPCSGMRLTDSAVHYLAKDDPHPMSRIAKQLDIPILLVDCRQTFKEHIIDYFIDDYRSGRTPNPCMLCNAQIKFGRLADIAREAGASCLATGHYARIVKPEPGRYQVRKGVDPHKEQSYFLALLSQEQLAFARLPLGEMTKTEVKHLTQKKMLQPLSASESQDICFIPEGSYADFLRAMDETSIKPGSIITSTGRIIGEHRGVHRYTIGQRKGLDCPAERPYYVIKIEPATHTVMVGFKEELYRSECRLSRVNWMIPEPAEPLPVSVRIRYRHKAVPAVLKPFMDRTAVIVFEKAQPAVAPGQIAVAYDNDLIVAGGFIDA
jgi:tRNA-uridine 2-sulfurtransferase